MIVLILSSAVSSSTSVPSLPRAMETAAEVRPPWLECASSMMMAKRRPPCPLPISSRMNGNFWTVEMMIFLPDSMNRRRSPEASAWPTMEETWANCLTVSLICLSRTRRSVTTMTESRTVSPSLSRPTRQVGEPGDGVRLTAASRVLDQVAPPDSPLGDVGQELSHNLELVESRPNLDTADSPGLPVLGLDDLGVVLDDVGEAVAGEHLLPQVVCLQAVGVGRVARGVAPALVEGQEPGRRAPEVGTEADLVVVDGEVYEASPELKQPLLRVAVAPVLLDRIGHGLLGEAVLELEGGDGQAVDEEAEVEGELGVAGAVPELAGDAEAVQVVEGRGLCVAWGGCAVEEVEVVGDRG